MFIIIAMSGQWEDSSSWNSRLLTHYLWSVTIGDDGFCIITMKVRFVVSITVILRMELMG